MHPQFDGASLRLTASGQNSGAVATQDFTDGGAFGYPAAQALTVTAGASNSNSGLVLTLPKNNALQTPTWTFAPQGTPTITVVNSSTPGTNQIGVTYTATADSDGGVLGTVDTGGGSGTQQTITYTFSYYAGSLVASNTYVINAVAVGSQAIANNNPSGSNGINTSVTVVAASTAAGTLAVAAQVGTATYSGAADNVTFDVAPTRTSPGLFNGTYSVTGLPAGATGSFSVTTFTADASVAFPNTTLTVGVDSTVSAGSYPISIICTPSNVGPSAFQSTGTLIVSKAATTTVVTVNGAPFTYTGSAQAPATVSVTGPGGLNLTPTASYSNNTSAGTATASYSYAGDANYLASSNSSNFTIDKAATTTVVSSPAGPFTYTGSAQTPATVSVTGAGGLNLAPTASYANNTNVGTSVASYSYAGDVNYLASSSSANFTISKATATVVVTPYTGTYNGSAQSATFTIAGVNGETGATVGTVDVSGTSHTNAGAYTGDVWAFTGTANYNSQSGTVDNVINKASTTTVVSVTGGPFTYNGSAQTPASVSVTGAGGLNLTPAASYSNNTSAGTATASYSYAGDANYLASSNSSNFTIDKAATTTVVSSPAGPFTYTGSAQTPATVSVTGVGGLNLTPAASYGNNTNAGTATASYSFAGDTNHLASSNSTNFTIAKAASTTVVSIGAGPFTYTGSTQTPATVSVSGIGGLNLTPAASYSNNTNAGTATASYSYAGDTNYLGSSSSDTFPISKATATVVVIPYTGTYDGSAQTATYTITGVNGETGATVGTVDVSGTSHTNAGTYSNDAWSFTGTNYSSQSGTVDNVISKAATTTVVSISTGPFTYTGSAQTPASVSVTGPGGLTLTPTASYSNNINAGTATASYSYGGDTNYLASSDSGDFTIDKASSTTVVSIGAGPFTYTGSAQTPATVSVTGPGLNLTPAASYSNNTNAGTATASYSYAGDSNYLASSDSSDFTISKASSTTVVSIIGGPFTYTGSAQTPATVSVTGAGGLNLTPTASYSNTTNAGTATASYSYAGDANYVASSNSINFTISKATATVVVTACTGTYNGSAQTATYTITGVNGETGAAVGTVDVSGTSHTNAGTYSNDAWSFTGTNYSSQSGTVDNVISKAATTTVVSISAGPFTYTGSTQTPASVSVTGPGGLTLTPTASYSNNNNAGTATASYSYGGDTNYLASSNSSTFTIDKASSTTVVSIGAGSFTYTGSAQTPATVSVTGVGGLSLSPAASYSNNTNAGTATASYSYAGDSNHLASSDSSDFTINKASSTTVVSITGGPFTYTGSTQTPATVSVIGVGGLNLTPAASYSNNTNAGTATASYSYAGDSNHLASSDSSDFTINKASTTTMVTTPVGTFLYTGSAITPATVSVTGAGGLNLTPDASYSNNVNVGTSTASYSYAGDANHEPSSDSEGFQIVVAPTVLEYRVLFGSKSYNLVGSSRVVLPWNVTAIEVVFSKPIYAGGLSSLTGVSTRSFSGVGTNTLKWTIDTLSRGSFSTMLSGTGSTALTDEFGFPLSGGGFSQSFKVLYGDFNGDGVVSSADLNSVNIARTAPYNIFADVDGDDKVNSSDLSKVRLQIGKRLPS